VLIYSVQIVHVYTLMILSVRNFALYTLIVLPRIALSVNQRNGLKSMRELMLMQPWQHRKGTSERGDDWEKLAVSLNAIPNSQFLLLSDLFVTPILQWKREEENSQGRRQSLRYCSQRGQGIESVT